MDTVIKYQTKPIRNVERVCKECGGTNWKAVIDSHGGEPIPYEQITKIVDDNFKELLSGEPK